MADISVIKLRKTNQTYNVKDATARESIATINSKLPSDASSSNKVASSSAVNALIDGTVGWVGGNELPNNLVSGSANHVNYSVKDNKSVEIYTDAGGSTAQTTMILVSSTDNYKPKAGQKILSVSEDATAIQIVVAGYNGTTWVKNLANTATHTAFTIDYDGYDRIGAYLLVNANNEIDHKIAYPMLRDASITDDTYVPSHESVEEALAKKVSIGNVITSSDDMNDVTETGIYGITTSPANAPESQSYCSLLVQKTSSGDLRQIIFKGGAQTAIYVRSYGGNPGSWASWYKFTGTVVS